MKISIEVDNNRALYTDDLPMCRFCKQPIKPNSGYFTSPFRGYKIEFLICRDCVINPKTPLSDFQKSLEREAALILINEIKIGEK